ncbi:MAG: hypothetical protein ACKVKT_01595 [Rhodospirillales bacterium]|jgi:hypothetical protein
MSSLLLYFSAAWPLLSNRNFLIYTVVDGSYRGRSLSIRYAVIAGGQALGALIHGS